MQLNSIEGGFNERGNLLHCEYSLAAVDADIALIKSKLEAGDKSLHVSQDECRRSALESHAQLLVAQTALQACEASNARVSASAPHQPQPPLQQPRAPIEDPAGDRRPADCGGRIAELQARLDAAEKAAAAAAVAADGFGASLTELPRGWSCAKTSKWLGRKAAEQATSAPGHSLGGS